jgi:hypothetical protein
MSDVIEILRWVAEHYGLYAAFVVYFLGRDAYRDWKQDKVISNLQSEMRGVILPIVAENAKVIAENSSALKASVDAVQECHELIHKYQILLEQGAT